MSVGVTLNTVSQFSIHHHTGHPLFGSLKETSTAASVIVSVLEVGRTVGRGCARYLKRRTVYNMINLTAANSWWWCEGVLTVKRKESKKDNRISGGRRSVKKIMQHGEGSASMAMDIWQQMT